MQSVEPQEVGDTKLIRDSSKYSFAQNLVYPKRGVICMEKARIKIIFYQNSLMFDYDQEIRKAFKSQYHAALEMMRRCIDQGSDELWTSDEMVNPYWRIVYHTLFFFRLYLHQHLDDHKHWEKHKAGAHNLSLDPDSTDVLPYTKAEMLEFLEQCKSMIDDSVQNMDLTRTDCGFHWYKVSKLEHMIVNLRHLQHHVAQLQDRLRNVENKGINWVRALDQEGPS